MKWLIYKHTSPSGKSYIGQTYKTITQRWKRHVSSSRRANIKHTFSYAVKKYGPENFIHEILEDNILTQEEANEREQYWIAFYDTFNNGYNQTSGGKQCVMSEESKLKRSKSMKAKCIKRQFTEEHKNKISIGTKQGMIESNASEKISQKLTGRRCSDEHRKNMSITRQLPENVQKSRERRLGKKTSEETKLKQSAALIGKPHTDEHNKHVKEALNKPETKKLCGEAAKKSWDDPIQREKRCEAQRQAWVKRKQNKLQKEQTTNATNVALEEV